MAFEANPLWYKDAVIYQIHVRSFMDSDNDGIGDFRGLASKLDYLEKLGVNTLWLLPFYPSPLKDDGFDISDYMGILPCHGTMDDFREFIRKAHARGMRVITELVLNHTSDQHPWFQRARLAPPGSPERDFYVWSDTDRKYPGVRIIFCDTEKSNWTWDPEAQAFYWHRFFSHQPDLNWNNPAVFEEMTRVMAHWLETGVDGLRLDAIPYLAEREGTDCENLPETHAVVKRLRTWMDAHYPGRMFLAEANMWPEDVVPYFGDGDECHMGYNFPVMPRLYMALAQEDRYPVIDIMEQTPEIPEGCQWATFLRCHDELTLEMVTERERQFMWNHYSPDMRARINLGIRRRLAPLMENHRQRVELMNGFLMSLPGTPIIYYGDEIGMGDNIQLKDRDGVRTPMQWSPDHNGGFSKADPDRLFLPAITDPVFGYQAVNVEAQESCPQSLLAWMRQIIRIRGQHPVFSRGTLEFLPSENRHVVSYLRRGEGETILVVANVSGRPQHVELDLSRFSGCSPANLSGGLFPPIEEGRPYRITLPLYGFFWLALRVSEAKEHAPAEKALAPEYRTLVLPKGWESMTGGSAAAQALGRILAGHLPSMALWNTGYPDIGRVEVEKTIPGKKAGTDAPASVCIRVQFRNGETRPFTLPLKITWEPGPEVDEVIIPPSTIARIRCGARIGFLHGDPGPHPLPGTP